MLPASVNAANLPVVFNMSVSSSCAVFFMCGSPADLLANRARLCSGQRWIAPIPHRKRAVSIRV